MRRLIAVCVLVSLMLLGSGSAALAETDSPFPLGVCVRTPVTAKTCVIVDW